MAVSSRQAYLDWLRILAITGVLFFHAAMPYAAEYGWHIKNKETSSLLLEMITWMHRFRMPLLFFISGTVSYFMLQKRSSGSFIGLRFRRLFIPLLFGMLVIVPPQVYMERLKNGYSGNYWQFYPTIFTTGSYPKGNLSWHHLWFILYLLLYDILCAPLFTWLISQRGKTWLQYFSWIGRRQYIYLLAIPGILIYALFAVHFPETNDLIHDYAYLPYWLFFLLAGFVCIANPVFMDSLERNRRTSLTLALLSLIAINYIRWNDLSPWDVIADYKHDVRTYLYMALSAVNAYAWVFTGIGYGKKYLNKPHPILNYVNNAVYPFYILHQTVIVILVYYIVKTTDTIGMKYWFTVLVTFVVSMGIYHVLIRPFAWMRLLFGMKPEQPKPKDRMIPVPEIPATVNQSAPQ